VTDAVTALGTSVGMRRRNRRPVGYIHKIRCDKVLLRIYRNGLNAVERAISMAKGNKVLSSGEVAKVCHVAPRTAQKWIDAGLLKGYRIPGSRDRRVPVEEMIRFMKQHGMPVSPELLKRQKD